MGLHRWASTESKILLKSVRLKVLSIKYSMNLTFNDLKKRDVINVADGRCLGNITDIDISFPSGTLVGIIVPGKRENCFMRIFDRSKIYISESNIIKIGGDVILVDLKCGETCQKNVKINPRTPPCPGILPCGPSNSDNAENKESRIDFSDYQ